MTTQSATTIQENSTNVEPNLTDLLNLLKKEIFLNLNCHHLGTIESFDPSEQTAQVTINYPKTVFQYNAQSGMYQGVQVNYPILVDVPVIILTGGKASLTFPIVQGDQCLLLFNDRNIDNWFQNGQFAPLLTSRSHAFSDCFALVGLYPQNNQPSSYDPTRVVLQNDTTGVGVSATQVKIYNQINGKLGDNFTAFFTALQAFMTACEGSSTDPVLAAAATAFMTAMSVPVAPTAGGPIVNIEGILE